MNTLNMDDLKWMFISGANNLSNNYKEVDALNVFLFQMGIRVQI